MQAVGAAVLTAALLVCTSCSKREFRPYSPHESLLSVAAEYHLLASTDPYTQWPVEDLTGRNIARSTLSRLANYERLHPGRFSSEVDFLRACALERLRDYAGAREAFLSAGDEPELRDESIRRAEANARLLNVLEETSESGDLMATLQALATRAGAFWELASDFDDSLYASLAKAESEQAEVARAELLVSSRTVVPDGNRQALEALQTLAANHRESVRALGHALRLASLYRELAEEEIRLRPPETAGFDARQVADHLERSLDLLYRVSQADGRPERLVARHELDAVLALREMVLDRAD